MSEKIINYKGVDYIVSDEGKVFSTKNIGRGKYHQELKQRIDADGYPTITVGTNKNRSVVRVHRLVAIAFIPNPDNLTDVDHINNDRTDNRVCNLQWLTHSDNVRKIPHETASRARRGSNNGRANLTENTVREIRGLYDSKLKNISELSREFNTPWSTINNIVKRHTWKHVS